MSFRARCTQCNVQGRAGRPGKGMARDLGPRGITINNVQPGPVDTDMNLADGSFGETLRKLMALPRYGAADEIAALVEYLAKRASSQVQA